MDGQTIGWINHNDDSPTDNPRRVELWLGDDGFIWADRLKPHKPDLDRPKDLSDAVLIVARAYSWYGWRFKTYA